MNHTISILCRSTSTLTAQILRGKDQPLRFQGYQGSISLATVLWKPQGEILS